MSALPQYPLHELPQEPPRRRWPRVVAWIVGVLGSIVLAIIIAAAILLHSARFHAYALRAAQQKATAAVGAPVQLRDFSLSLSHLSLDLYGLTVHGAGAHPNPPLLQADHIGLSIRVTSLLHRKWYLNNITVNHPVVHALVDASGANNFPKSKTSSQSHTGIFDLGVRHAVLDRGEIYYNNQKSTLEADLHDLSLQSVYDAAIQRYSGSLNYRDGHLKVANYNPIPHNLDASFDLTPSELTLRQAMLSSGASRFTLSATAQNFSQPVLDAKYDAALDATEFRRLLKNTNLPIGTLHLAGTLHYESVSGQPPLDSVTLNGNLSSRALTLRTPKLSTTLSNLAANYAVANGNAALSNLRARILGGALGGEASARNLAGATQAHVHASLTGASLAALQGLVQSAPAQQTPLSGTANLTVDATSGKNTRSLVANVTSSAHGAIGSPQALPFSASLQARYLGAGQQLIVAPSSLHTPQTSINLSGAISNRSALAIHAQANDLHELETISDALRRRTPGKPQQQLGLYGTASFNGSVRGSTSSPQITGKLVAANVRVKGSSWRSLRTNIGLSPSLASLADGNLAPAGKGNINFSLSAGLRRWSFTPDSPIAVNLKASQLDVANLARAAGTQMPIAGTLAVTASVRGSELAPVGQGFVRLTQAKVESEPIQSLNVNFAGTAQQLRANIALRMPAGATDANLVYAPKQRAYQLQLRSPGIRLEQLETLKQTNLPIAGTVVINASGQGTLDNPGLAATLRVPQLRISNQTVSQLALNANVANHLANIALDSNALNTSIRGRAQINLTGNYETSASLDTQSIPLQPLVAAYAPAQADAMSGQTELHATVRGPLKEKSQIEAHVNIPTLQLNYKNTFQLAAATPIKVDYAQNVLTLQRTSIRGTDTDLEFQGSIPMASDQPASLLAQGTVDLEVLQLFTPDVASSGLVRLNVNSFGARANPNVQGQIRIENANFATASIPLGVQNANGVLTLTKDRLDITSFQATVGGGPVTAQGGVVYRPAMRFDLALSGKHIRTLYPDGVRGNLDTDLRFTGAPQSAQLTGRVGITQLSFTPTFDFSDFMGQFSTETAAPPPTGGMAQNVQLDVAVQSTTGLNLVSKQLSLEGSANLRVRGTAAQPVILGRIDLNGGDLIYMNNHYVLQGGTIDFANASETLPVVNITANTTVQQYDIHLHIEGPIDNLRTNYSSDPALPPADVISLLAFGTTSEESAANPTPGNVAAENAVASQVTSTVTNRIQKIAGISQLSVDPVLGGGSGSQQNPGARVTIQQRVTSNIFVTFSTDVTSTQTQQIQLEYKLSPRLSLSGNRDQNGGFGFDVRIHKSW